MGVQRKICVELLSSGISALGMRVFVTGMPGRVSPLKMFHVIMVYHGDDCILGGATPKSKSIFFLSWKPIKMTHPFFFQAFHGVFDVSSDDLNMKIRCSTSIAFKEHPCLGN